MGAPSQLPSSTRDGTSAVSFPEGTGAHEVIAGLAQRVAEEEARAAGCRCMGQRPMKRCLSALFLWAVLAVKDAGGGYTLSTLTWIVYNSENPGLQGDL